MMKNKIVKYLGGDNGVDDMIDFGDAQLWFGCMKKKITFEITLGSVGSLVIPEKQMRDLIELFKIFEKKVLLE